MKQTSRKKVLLSSVAMMMVATVSLGSATFAWFSTNTTATANDILVQTTQASNLLIRKGTGGTAASTDWANSITFDTAATTLEPVSTDDLTNWFTALAPSFNATGIKAGSVKDVSSTKTGYVVEKEFQLYYKGEAEAADMDVTYTIGVDAKETGDDDYLRVAIYDVTGLNTVCIYGNAADGYAVTAEDGTLAESTNVTTVEALGDLGTFEPGNIKTYRAVVWYEGTDPHCIDNAAQTLNDITLTFNKKTATTP